MSVNESNNKDSLIFKPDNRGILVFDGSSYAAIAIGDLSEIVGREVDLVSNDTEARCYILDNPNKYIAMLTEPMTYFTRRHMRRGYRDFLETVRTCMNLPVILYTTQSENTTNRRYGLEEWGLVRGKHYDAFIRKVDRDATAQLKTFLDKVEKYNY